MEQEHAVARTGELGYGAPAALAVAEEDEADELLVLLRRPQALLQPHLVAARLPTHGRLLEAMDQEGSCNDGRRAR